MTVTDAPTCDVLSELADLKGHVHRRAAGADKEGRGRLRFEAGGRHHDLIAIGGDRVERKLTLRTGDGFGRLRAVARQRHFCAGHACAQRIGDDTGHGTRVLLRRRRAGDTDQQDENEESTSHERASTSRRRLFAENKQCGKTAGAESSSAHSLSSQKADRGMFG